MAPYSAVIKNGILYLILMAGVTYLGAQLVALGIGNILSGYGLEYKNEDDYKSGIKFLWLGLLLLMGIGGLFYMKALSDVVEEGLIEF